MHGRLKVKSSFEKEQEKIIERNKKMKLFKMINSNIFDMKSKGDYSIALLNLTSEILCLNPDFYTLWNIRKELFERMKSEGSKDFESLTKKELIFLNECLKLNPKSYSAWKQRCFIMQLTNDPDWKHELELTSNFLEYDDRNFHCWDYRRFIVERCNESLESELLFSTKKISTDFSNFSSWHYRGNLISQIYPNLFVDNPDVLLKEYSLVENAIFTDPSDQSGWFYLKWLSTRKGEYVQLKHLLIDPKGGTMILIFSSPLEHIDAFVLVNQKEIKLTWRGITNRKFNTMFNAELKDIDNSSDLSFNIQLKSKKFKNGSISVECLLQESSSFLLHPCDNLSQSNESFETTMNEFFKKQLTSLQGLNEFESDNKFTLHTLISLMKKLDLINYYNDILKYIQNLIILDPARKMYYSDLESKLKIERCLKGKADSVRSIDLSNLSLTTLSCCESMFWLKSINLSNNNLTDLNNAHFLQCIELLILSNNKIESCNKLFNLKKLAILDLTNNNISDVDDLKTLCSCPRLQTILLSNNPITLMSNYQCLVKNILPHVKHFD